MGRFRYQDFTVELVQDGGLTSERGYVSQDGRFEFRNVDTGNHRLRIATLHGDLVREEHVNFSGDHTPVTIRLQTVAGPQRAGGAISAKRLAFRPSKNAKREWKEADACIRKGDHAGAAQHLRECVAHDPDYFEAHLNLGTALLMTGDPAGALAAYDKALEIDPLSAKALINRGMVLLHFKRIEEAHSDATKALNIEESESAHYVMGMSLAAGGRELPSAVEHLKLASRRHPQALQMAARVESFLKAQPHQ